MNAWKRFRDPENRRGLALISPTLLWMIGLLIIPLVLILRKPKHLREPMTVLPSPNGDLRRPLVE